MSSVSTQKSFVKRFFWLILKVYLGIFILLILAWGINLAWHACDLYKLARNLQSNPTFITPGNLVTRVQRASGDVGTIYSELNPLFPLFNTLQKVPWVGPYLGQVEPLLTYANGLSQAGKEISLGVAPLLEPIQPDQSSLSFSERASLALQEGQSHFVIAALYIDQASAVRSRINPSLLPESGRSLFQKLDSKFNLIVAGAQLLKSAPNLLGNSQAQTYLVLAQNRDELRATGGFISGIGLLILEQGKITQFSLGDSYAVDDFTKPYPPPPEPLKRFMLADYWVTRDANWSPDFPTAAKQVQALYSLSTGKETQGIVAFNQLFIRGILQVIGSVQVPGTEEPVTADNVENYMRQAWAPEPQEGLSGEWWQHRKDFMQLLGNVILEKAISLQDPDQLLNLASTISGLLDQGQLLIYFNDPASEQSLKTSRWDGALHPGQGDYVYLVDSNVGFNKVDSVIKRSLSYQVDLRDINHPTGKITISYQNTGSGDVPCKQIASYGNGTYLDLQTRCYWDYWRIYTPIGSFFTSGDVQPVAAEALLNGQGWSGQVESQPGEANTQEFSGLLVLPLSHSASDEVSYNLPLSVLKAKEMGYLEYSLTIQVQPGLDGLPCRVEVSLPVNSRLVTQAAGWQQSTSGSWVWQAALSHSVELSLTFEIKP
jgi:Protein of unknown function (DUF4012)